MEYITFLSIYCCNGESLSKTHFLIAIVNKLNKQLKKWHISSWLEFCFVLLFVHLPVRAIGFVENSHTA